MNIIQRLKAIYQRLLEKREVKKLNTKAFVDVDDAVTPEADCSMPIRFGVIGTGHVFDRFMNDMNMLDFNISVKAVCSDNSNEARKKAEKYNIPVVYDSYEEMLCDKDINAVYVATPNHLHSAHTLQALKAGKNVLCEKPVAINLSELEEMFRCADDNNCFLMEGMWTRTLPMIKKLKSLVDGGEIGRVKLVQTRCFNSNSPDDYPAMFSIEKAGGALMDVGCYGLHFADLFFGDSDNMNSTCDIFETGVDASSTITLNYKNGGIAIISQSLRAQGGAFATIHGENGYIEIPMFLSPSEFTVYKNGQSPTTYKYSKPKEKRLIGYGYEIVHFADCIRLGKYASDIIPREKSLKISKEMQTVRYNADMYFQGEN